MTAGMLARTHVLGLKPSPRQRLDLGVGEGRSNREKVGSEAPVPSHLQGWAAAGSQHRGWAARERQRAPAGAGREGQPCSSPSSAPASQGSKGKGPLAFSRAGRGQQGGRRLRQIARHSAPSPKHTAPEGQLQRERPSEREGGGQRGMPSRGEKVHLQKGLGRLGEMPPGKGRDDARGRRLR